MAKKEKKQKNTNKKRKTILWIGLGILAVGLLAFGGTLLAGLITLARDLLITAVALDTLLVGGALGKKAIDGITSAISNRKAKKLQRDRTKEKTRSNDIVIEQENTLESIPVQEEEKENKVVEVIEDNNSEVKVTEKHFEDGSIEFTFGEEPKKETAKTTTSKKR